MPAASHLHIYCPRCHWKADGAKHWLCSCGRAWSSFDTAGVCPKCQRRWQSTACPTPAGGCGAVSPHIDWYHGLDALIAEMLK